MGNALAAAGLRQGARVTLVTAAPAPAAQPGLDIVAVETAAEMHAAVRAALAIERSHHGRGGRGLATTRGSRATS